MRLLFVVATVACVGACAGIRTGKGGTPIDRQLPPSDVPGARTPGAPKERGIRETSKRVAGKRPPTTLIAADSSRCEVTEEQFQSTREGDSFLCTWAPAPGKSGT